MAEITVANTYAQALFDLGTELGKAEQFNREITELDDVLQYLASLHDVHIQAYCHRQNQITPLQWIHSTQHLYSTQRLIPPRG